MERPSQGRVSVKLLQECARADRFNIPWRCRGRREVPFIERDDALRLRPDGSGEDVPVFCRRNSRTRYAVLAGDNPIWVSSARFISAMISSDQRG